MGVAAVEGRVSRGPGGAALLAGAGAAAKGAGCEAEGSGSAAAAAAALAAASAAAASAAAASAAAPSAAAAAAAASTAAAAANGSQATAATPAAPTAGVFSAAAALLLLSWWSTALRRAGVAVGGPLLAAEGSGLPPPGALGREGEGGSEGGASSVPSRRCRAGKTLRTRASACTCGSVAATGLPASASTARCSQGCRPITSSQWATRLWERSRRRRATQALRPPRCSLGRGVEGRVGGGVRALAGVGRGGGGQEARRAHLIAADVQDLQLRQSRELGAQAAQRIAGQVQL